MPIIDRRAGLVPANSRNADVASKLLDDIMPVVQQKFAAAFRVQGIQAVLYNRLTQGRRCTCNTRNNTVAGLSPDGKASTGAINRVLSGVTNFGVSDYKATPEDDFNSFHDSPTSPNNAINQWLGDLNLVGSDDGGSNQVENESAVGDDGQFSPDLENLFNEFDMSHLGVSDVSCPICFGAGYVGGYSMFRGNRQTLVPTDFATQSFLDPKTFELSPGVHTATLVFPLGASGVDAFRVFLNDKVVAAEFTIDGVSASNRRVLNWCDGKPHTLVVTTQSAMTHMEIQFALSQDPVYFEIPKLTKTADISFLEQQEPFQIVMSPDVPLLQSMDLIAESQLGKILIVQTVNPWNTRNRSMLGHECMVRVAQPQELWRIMPFRLPVNSQKTTNLATPTKGKPMSGVNQRGFTF